ncbi:hypothetical protein [Streptomyces silvensis]|uniref:Uncharacterized protein n=1 Tax=Streptomyces silvensis TaxID=1765722 RepID=A0A0W7X9J2_9ACTN|nr:hypothetical protein [Streptomyces silvensis]KUF19567.1 hypothetical protein AT728_04120 [Streptomyces silvensis]
MIRPQLSADGRTVRLPLAEHVDPLLDELALAYAQAPEDIGRLLAAHAASVVALDFAMCSDDATDYGRAVRATEADATREALLDDCPAAVTVDPLLAPDDAISLAGRITRVAAHIRHRTAQNRNARP